MEPQMTQEVQNVSRFHYLPSEELDPIIESAMAETNDEGRDVWVALFRNRALNLIRKGSSLALRREAAVLNRNLFSPAGRQVQRDAAAYHARLATIADMLSTAGQRTDTAFLNAVLASHSKYAQRICELLARAGANGLPRRELLAKLDVTESHLSHILADLEKAHVVVRLRSTGTKEVRVTLDSAGRDLVTEQLEPRWFVAIAEVLDDVARGNAPPPASKVASKLERANVPSQLVVARVHDLLATMADAAGPAGSVDRVRLRHES
jgi:hypothetical protein